MCWKYQRISPVSGFQGQRRVRIQRRARGAALHDGPRLGLGGGPVDQVGVGVVAARNPCVGAGAPAQGQVAPGVSSRVSGARDRRRAPQLGPGVGVVGRDEADVVLVPLAPRHPRDDLAPHHDRAAGVPVAEAAVGHLVLPDELAGPRVEGDELGAARAGEDPVAVDGDAAPRHARAEAGLPVPPEGRTLDSVCVTAVCRQHAESSLAPVAAILRVAWKPQMR